MLGYLPIRDYTSEARKVGFATSCDLSESDHCTSREAMRVLYCRGMRTLTIQSPLLGVTHFLDVAFRIGLLWRR